MLKKRTPQFSGMMLRKIVISHLVRYCSHNKLKYFLATTSPWRGTFTTRSRILYAQLWWRDGMVLQWRDGVMAGVIKREAVSNLSSVHVLCEPSAFNI